jgi:hypothetical protein
MHSAVRQAHGGALRGRVGGGFRVAPAGISAKRGKIRAAGFADHVWTAEEIVRLLA